VHLEATFFFTNALRKNSCIGKKCRNDVQKFTPTKISEGEFFLGYMSGRNTGVGLIRQKIVIC